MPQGTKFHGDVLVFKFVFEGRDKYDILNFNKKFDPLMHKIIKLSKENKCFHVYKYTHEIFNTKIRLITKFSI